VDSPSVLDAAIKYASIGLAVIPLHGKKPYFDDWPNQASTSEPLIRKWWTQDPGANVGIATGRRSNVFVLDVDLKNGGQESLDALFHKHGCFEPTWTAITGSGGSHYFFRYPAMEIGTKAGILPGLDIRGNGGQVVAAPSIHPDTHRRYIWDGLREPWDDPKGLAEAPAWLLEMLTTRPRSSPVIVPGKIVHGVQHRTLVSLAGQMRRMGLSADEIYPSLMRVNERRCQTPGSADNIRQIADSMEKYQPAEKNLYRTANEMWRIVAAHEERLNQIRNDLLPVDGLSLLRADLQPVKEIIDGILYNGLTILAGPPKAGKSYLTLCMAISVAAGAKFLNAKRVSAPGRVSYFALEESKRRTASRLRQLTHDEGIEFTQNIEFLYAIKSLNTGGLGDLDAYLGQAKPTLAIIDTLMAFVTGDRNSRSDVFRRDYQELKSIQELAIKHETAIVVVHHTNKLGGEGIGSVAGTHGVTAAADSIWTMQRQPQRRAIVQVTGREVEEQALLLELELREPIGWFLVEQGDDVALSEERLIILDVLKSGDAKTPKQLASEIGKNPVSTRWLLRKMMLAGQLVQDTRGSYRLNTLGTHTDSGQSWRSE
jgi:Bifunctional DNA primase/polymerase, N-terminal/AAA domain